MDQIKQILLFNQVLSLGSMSAAAKALSITPSAISQQLTQLEKHYGIKLLNRSTRQIQATEAGKALWQHAIKIQQQLTQAEQQLAELKHGITGKVSISLPSVFLNSLAICRFIEQLQQKYPNIQLHLEADDQIIDLWEKEIDIAIRAVEPMPDSELIARYLATWQLMICASPSYLLKKPIKNVQDLLHQQWIITQNTVWQQAFKQTELANIANEQTLYCPLLLGARQLVLAGQGLTFMLSGEAKPFIDQGQLQQVKIDLPLPTYNIYALTLERQVPAKISAVLELLKDCFKENF